MKILILVESLKVGGGSERFASILGSKLYEEGYDISYLTLMEESPKFDFKGDYYTLNEGNIYGNIFKRTLDLFWYAPKITKLCKDLDIETIISISEIANFHAVLSRYLYGNEVRIIASQHINPAIFLNDKIKSSLIKFFYQHADTTVCVSKEIERILNEKYAIQNTTTIYNMMDIEENLKLSTKKLPEKYQKLFMENNNKTFHFISIGRLTRQKGHWFLIRSFRRLIDVHPYAKLFILGEGILRNELETLIKKLELEKNVYVMGEQKNVFTFLKNSDCFVFSSLWEGFGLVLIEALSLDLPVISTDCKAGPREILSPELDLDTEIEYPYKGEYGILTQNFPNELLLKGTDEVRLIQSEEILSDLMIKIIEDEELRKKYSNGLLLAENYDVQKILTKWNKLLQS